MRPTVLAIQNDASDPPLLIGEWLGEAELGLEVVEAFAGAPVPSEVPESIAGVLALGGVMGAGDDDVAPWLPNERALLADAVERGVPVLGVCLGAQLLAAATGGLVTRGPATEIGVVQTRRTVEGLIDPVLSQAQATSGEAIPALHWHHDNIVELPDAAVLLLTNDSCPVQGFKVGTTAYGLQMHPEVDLQTFASWAGEGSEELRATGREVADAVEDVRIAQQELITSWRPAILAWASLVWDRSRESLTTS